MEHDKKLPSIIATYKRDLAKMEAGAEKFGKVPVTEQLKQDWRNSIKEYEIMWGSARKDFRINVKVSVSVRRSAKKKKKTPCRKK